jgi:hypothetical protein
MAIRRRVQNEKRVFSFHGLIYEVRQPFSEKCGVKIDSSRMIRIGQI